MSQDHRYTLTSNKAPKLDCPKCNAPKHWQRYLDTYTGELLPPYYGRCDNEGKCKAWNDPYKDGYTKAIWECERGADARFPQTAHHQHRPQITKQKETVFIPGEALTPTLQGYERNTFIQNLLHRVPFPLEAADVQNAIAAYYLGTISEGYMSGAVTFPFIDISGNIHAVQAKTFDAANHTTRTSSLPYILEQQHTTAAQPSPDWLKAYKESGSGFSCLFGEHLLSRYPHHTIALVEAPKTAIYGALYFGLPEDSDLIWLAVYNKSAFTFGRLQALRGRNVIIFPDLSKDGSTFAQWSVKAADFEKRMPGTHFTVSELLEESAGAADRAAGNDLADVLIMQDWRGYRNPPPTPPAPTFPETPTPQPPEPLKDINSNASQQPPQSEPLISVNKPQPFPLATPAKPQPVLYPLTKGAQQELEELEAFFSEFELPDYPVKVGECETISNPAKYIPAAIILIRQHHGHGIYSPYLERLKRLRDLFTLAEDLAPTNGPQTANTTLLQL